MNIVIIGGGKASVVIINHFVNNKEVRIIGICDLDETAEGVIQAKKHGILTSNKIEEMVSRSDVNMVIELTGEPKVRQMCAEILRKDQDIITFLGGQLMCSIIDSIAKSAARVANEIHHLTSKMVNVIESVDKTVINIRSILIKIQMIAINGNIEACKAGKNGAAFAVVAQHLGELVNEVDTAVEQIVASASEGHSVLNALVSAERNLRTNLD